MRSFDSKDKVLLISLIIKLILATSQITAGIYSNSMALIADALHNLTDSSALLIALFAQVIAKRPPDALKTFGYKRVEVVAALINLTTMILMGIYLIIEAVGRVFSPHYIESEIVIITALVAFIVDALVAALLYLISRNSINLKAAFLDSVSDALGSIAVFISGILIMYYNLHAADVVITILIAIYIIYHATNHLPQVINILVGAKPKGLDLTSLTQNLEETEGVINIHHMHVWQLDEVQNALEAHVVINNFENMEKIKEHLKTTLKEKYNIGHSTLEFERYEPGFKKDSCG